MVLPSQAARLAYLSRLTAQWLPCRPFVLRTDCMRVSTTLHCTMPFILWSSLWAPLFTLFESVGMARFDLMITTMGMKWAASQSPQKTKLKLSWCRWPQRGRLTATANSNIMQKSIDHGLIASVMLKISISICSEPALGKVNVFLECQFSNTWNTLFNTVMQERLSDKLVQLLVYNYFLHVWRSYRIYVVISK